MFDLGWSEMLIIAVVAIIVVGPKDLPKMLRTLGKFVGQAKRMANEFTGQFQDALRESELDELKKDFESVTKVDPLGDLQNSIDKDLNDLDRDLNETVRDLDKADEAENAAYEAANENKIDDDFDAEEDPGIAENSELSDMPDEQSSAMKAASGDKTGA